MPGIAASHLDIVLFFGVKALAGCGHLLVGDIVGILHHLVDDAVGGQLYDAVAHGLDELMVVRRQQDIAFEVL